MRGRKFEHATLLSTLVLVLVAPALPADEFEDLDVTMDILESESELDVLVSQMRGPERTDADRELGREEQEETRDSPFEENEFTVDDDFERDNLFRRQELTEEDDFESLEGEDLNFDLPPPPEPEPAEPAP
jgi:hypothetical protein